MYFIDNQLKMVLHEERLKRNKKIRKPRKPVEKPSKNEPRDPQISAKTLAMMVEKL